MGLDICRLSVSATGDFQIMIAVAGKDLSIEVLTLECSTAKGLSAFNTYTIFKDSHPAAITKLVFSTFHAPPTPSTTSAGPQTVKLASVSFGQTVVVHTLPLQLYSPRKNKTARYVLSSAGSSHAWETTFSTLMAILVIAVVSFLLQAFTEIRGGVPPTLGAPDWLSPRWKEMIHRPYLQSEPYILQSSQPIVSTVKHTLEDLVALQSSAETPKAIIIREDHAGQVSTGLLHGNDITENESMRKWEDLQEHEQDRWRKRLTDTGHWTAKQGEKVLKGLFFGELAGAVADAVRGA